jgi:membrane protease YdiL (CAAX protease family)
LSKFISQELLSLSIGSIWLLLSWWRMFRKKTFILKGLQDVPVTFFHLVLAIFLFLLPYLFVGGAIAVFSLYHYSTLFSFIASSFSAIFVLFFLTHSLGKSIWFDQFCPKDFLTGVFAWFWVYPAVLVISRLFSLTIYFFSSKYEGITQVPIEWLKEQSNSPVTLSLAVIQIVLIAPLVEEFLFRGILQRFLRRHLGKVWSWLVTAILFAFVHIRTSQGISNIEIFVSLFTLSFFLSILFERTRSLLSPIGLHLTFNAITSIIILFRDQ